MAVRFSDLLLDQSGSGKRKPIDPWHLSIGLSLLVTACLILLNSTGFFQILEWTILDQFFRLRSNEQADPRITLVTIDESDISTLQEWPLSDENLAKLLTKINQYEPRVIGLDIYRNFSVAPGKEKLESVFRDTPNLIGVEKVGHTPVPPPPLLDELGRVAMADILIDDDAKVRRALLAVSLDGEVKWTLGTASALYYLEQEGISLDERNSVARLGDVSFPRFEANDGGYVNADDTGYQLLLNYRGPDNAFNMVSITDVINGEVSEADLRDRIVFIGSIAPSLNDFLYTPYGKSTITGTTQSPGVAIHAHIASQIVSAVLDRRSLIRTWTAAGEWAWIFLWCALGSGFILIPRFQGRKDLTAVALMALPVLGLGTILIVISGLLFLSSWWVPTTPALLGLIVSSTASLTLSNLKLIKDAYLDELTNVFNRRAFNQKIAEIQSQPKAIAIILCDVDFFKGFNDRYGHPAGDECLRKVAKAIEQAVRSQDVVARYGGEEFAVILPNVSQETAREIAQRMCEKVQGCEIPHADSKVSPYVSISCGVAIRAADVDSSMAQILIKADKALYQAKRLGRNRVSLSGQADFGKPFKLPSF
ncbi:diguanylate cyclase [filamentous cyanobacterium CCP5]|nr:diguanylate cyclase [filamentous cyanobacterium CCP5]